MKNTVHIWDTEEIGSSEIDQNILWRSYTNSLNEKSVSIPRLVEKNSSYLKELFFAWVFELGEVRVEGKRVVDHLKISPSFSFWWMSLIPQKLNYSASPHITTAIRLLAFDLWARDREINVIRFSSHNKALAEFIQRWCLVRKVHFVWEFLPSNNSSTRIVHNSYRRLPNICKALVQFIRRICFCWPLRNYDDVCFVSTSKELSEALNSITPRDVGSYEKKEFFTLDSELPRWKKLLLESKT